jgi:hypothetical protein
LLDENEKLALVLELRADGPESIVVSGAAVSGASIVQLWAAGEASVFAAASLARTLSSWPPTASAL